MVERKKTRTELNTKLEQEMNNLLRGWVPEFGNKNHLSILKDLDRLKKKTTTNEQRNRRMASVVHLLKL